MKKQLFNTGWGVRPGVPNPFGMIFGSEPPFEKVLLPQDQMILEERDPKCLSKGQNAFYPSKTYTYEKTFFVPAAWKDQESILEFEGVMTQAMVYLNDELITTNRYGYSQFFAALNPYLRFGAENTLRVIARSTESASRWYPGSGIYRDVWLHQGSLCHLVPEGVRLTTESVDEDGYALVLADVKVKNGSLEGKNLQVSLTLTSPSGLATTCTNKISLLPGEEASAHMRLFIPSASLWSPDEPNLYRWNAVLLEDAEGTGKALDEAEDLFGIRTLSLDARHGLRINGKEFKMRGACIHHDNGIIGASTLPDAEEFRLRKMKEAGFNAIRSAHHPAGKALLRLCDKLGIMVMDEVADMWEEPKNNEDYALDFTEEWDDTIRRIVSKDYNHASVILYSLGNEIPEVGRRNGRRRARAMANLFRSLDSKRYVTIALNGYLAMADQLPVMVEMFKAAEEDMKKAQASASEKKDDASSGSEALNAALAKMAEERMDKFSKSKPLSDALEEINCEMDVVGYNYLTARHENDHLEHPDRVVVGSETFPTEIARLWTICKANHHVIGDFTWTGYDYVGEAFIAGYSYDPDRKEQGIYPDRLAYCGDITLNGYRRPMSYLREIAFGLRKEPFIAVDRVEHFGQPDPSNNWKYYDCLDSWTYDGLEGKPTMARVLSASEEVELFLNGKSLGRKPAGEAVSFETNFPINYEPGELKAVGYTGGKEDGTFILRTSSAPAKLAISVSKEAIEADGRGLSLITVDLVDAAGIPNRWEKRKVTVKVEGPATLAGFGSDNPSCEGSYSNDTWETFDGRVMAAIRSTNDAGTIKVHITSPGLPEETVTIESK